MKRTIITIIAAIMLSASLAFTAGYEAKQSTAEVHKLRGCYIFVDSEPISEYETLGSVKSSMTWGSGQYEDIRDRLIKKAKQDYPRANGIIFYFNDGGTDRADAILIQ